MKTLRLSNLKKKICLAIIMPLIVFSFISCATSVSFLNSSVVPGAQGSVKIKSDKNKNYAIQITLTDLAESKMLQPPKLTYVVWIVTDRDMTKNMGQLNSSRSAFSKQLKGSFKTVSSFKPIKIFITAEDDSGAQFPGTLVILTTDQFQLR